MLTALAGSSQYRHDAKKGRFLLRRPDEKLFVPFLYSYLPALFIATAALLSLVISTTAPLNAFLIAEAALFIIFAALCSLVRLYASGAVACRRRDALPCCGGKVQCLIWIESHPLNHLQWNIW